ncbi:hypothetical protein NDU88_005195 [Pleurodeles waltl]|uniref:Uncharacterized protein n=1 Tax=Pleurodeles waltl TaxID=8319 RepID=A0AAV7RNK9_PLEWA|nr:hypothetical protein NDU88_005195 [Pleurodeles waltl]
MEDGTLTGVRASAVPTKEDIIFRLPSRPSTVCAAAERRRRRDSSHQEDRSRRRRTETRTRRESTLQRDGIRIQTRPQVQREVRRSSGTSRSRSGLGRETSESSPVQQQQPGNTYYSSNKSKGSPLAHGRSDQIRLSDLIGCPIQPYGAADVSLSGDMSADTRCHPHPILSVKSGWMETLFSIRPGWGSDRMGSDESGQAVRSHPIPHREQRSSDISLSAHSAETELSSAGSAGISGSIPAEQRMVRNVFVCH